MIPAAPAISASLLVMSLSCAPSVTQDMDGGSEACTPSESRCRGPIFQVCNGQQFVESATCSRTQVCDDRLGCVECRPNAQGRSCQGDVVHECNLDGTLGAQLESCGSLRCQDGQCKGDCTADGVELIYVVDSTRQLLSFDPRSLPPQEPFRFIGRLNCPASSPYSEFSGQTPTPFSMSVDRNATAWVLYNSGEIFSVSTTTAQCERTPFQRSQQGFRLFGLGFVSNGQNNEQLYISGGGTTGSSGDDRLGSIDPTSLTVTEIGRMSAVTEFSPELTGTSDGDLFAYFPSTATNAIIARLSKTNANMEQQWSLPASPGTVTAWAFAHWGGDFYVFVTHRQGFSDQTQVIHLDGRTGTAGVVSGLENIPFRIVGAGVSTCAPVFIP